MDTPTPNRRNRYILVALLTIVILPALIAIVANIVFLAGSIPGEKLAPPARLLTLKPDPSTAPVAMKISDQLLITDTADQQKNYLDFCRSRNPAGRNFAILAKWDSQWKTLDKEYDEVFNRQINGKYTTWIEDQPLTEEMAKWLRDHADFIKDIVDLANSGGLPEISCEQAASLSDESLENVINPYYVRSYFVSRTLAAEARRRQDIGDFAGAAEIVLALSRLGRSADEPSLFNLSVAYSSFGRAEFSTMRHLLSGSIPLESAKLLHEEFDKIPPDDFRRQLEIYYRGQRHNAVKWLNAPYSALFALQWSMSSRWGGSPNPDFKRYLSSLSDRTFGTVTDSIAPALQTARMKSQAASVIAEIDDHFAQYTEKFKPANFWNTDPKYFKLKSTGNAFIQHEYEGDFPEHAKRFKARRNLEFAGLDYILDISKDGTTTRTDPFTGTPLKVIQKENEIVIYSVGPDRKDHHAAAEYDDTKSAIPGDITIHLPKRKETSQ